MMLGYPTPPHLLLITKCSLTWYCSSKTLDDDRSVKVRGTPANSIINATEAKITSENRMETETPSSVIDSKAHKS